MFNSLTIDLRGKERSQLIQFKQYSHELMCVQFFWLLLIELMFICIFVSFSSNFNFRFSFVYVCLGMVSKISAQRIVWRANWYYFNTQIMWMKNGKILWKNETIKKFTSVTKSNSMSLYALCLYNFTYDYVQYFFLLHGLSCECVLWICQWNSVETVIAVNLRLHF